MSKPMGMTSSFQIVQLTRIEDAFYDAVCMAIDNGWSPDQVIKEIRLCVQLSTTLETRKPIILSVAASPCCKS